MFVRILVIALFCTLVIWGLVVFERVLRRRQQEGSGCRAPRRGREARPDAAPDLPRPFAASRCWFVVRTTDAAAVAAAMHVRTLIPASWQQGIAGTRTEGVFVTPPVDGFVLVIGADADCERPRLQSLLRELSRRFGEAQWFCADDALMNHGWALARRGEVLRAWFLDGAAGEVVWDEGDITRAEVDLGFFVDDPRDHSDDPVKWWPVHADVLALAARWGVDPKAPGRGAVPANGAIGRL